MPGGRWGDGDGAIEFAQQILAQQPEEPLGQPPAETVGRRVVEGGDVGRPRPFEDLEAHQRRPDRVEMQDVEGLAAKRLAQAGQVVPADDRDLEKGFVEGDGARLAEVQDPRLALVKRGRRTGGDDADLVAERLHMPGAIENVRLDAARAVNVVGADDADLHRALTPARVGSRLGYRGSRAPNRRATRSAPSGARPGIRPRAPARAAAGRSR